MSHSPPTDRLTRFGGPANRPVYYDDRRGTYHTWYDRGEYEPVSTAILMAVSSIRGIDPEYLEPLRDAIDPDALNELFNDWDGQKRGLESVAVSFIYGQCTVTVHGDGEIVIEPMALPVT
ncbi:HalOD1 output domain-containing protein [Natronosalvus vescus]|uniref:HalOD1 output domain-containing protein n=1 Tax=Natronosalvus vescus TaxID=2953881 RepID=UPI00209164AF|nr:HalOD1 output domain-containing protein [Natronosalvus vescus]